VIEYNKEKTRGKCEQEVLRGKEREIEHNISQFFRTINEKNYFEIQPKTEKEQSYRVKFNYTIREREKYAFEEVLASMQAGNPIAYRTHCKKLVDSKRPLCDIEYFIEYSSEKNHICVKLYNPSIVSSIEASDFLIFQSNVLTFDPVSVSIELS
jgi:predicted ATPase